jgi:hypothetical protein
MQRTRTSRRTVLDVQPLEGRSLLVAITGLSAGAVGRGDTLVISGSDFKVKSPAPPLIWADFEDGLNPTGLGLRARWNDVGNIAASPEGFSGGGAKGAAGVGNWTLGVDYDSWTKEGQRAYIFKREKMNFAISDPSQNWKTWRVWPNAGSGYPNLYVAANNGRIYVEDIADSGFWADPARTREPANAWFTHETTFRASSAPGVKDGRLTLKYNNQTAASGALTTRSSSSPAYMDRNYVVHGVLANKSLWKPAWSSSNTLWVDDVYVDTTWARVMLGNAPTYEASTKTQVQIPKVWADGSVTVTVNTDSFAPGERAYLYVFDRDDNHNASGYPVMIRGSALTSLTVDDVTVWEGSDGGTTHATFTVRLSAPSPRAVTIGYATANGTATAGEDYTPTSGSLTFSPGETSKAITVAVIARTGAEPDETFFVDLRNPVQATIADGRGVGTILNDDTSLSIADARVVEGNSGTRSATFTATLSSAVPFPVRVSYATADGMPNPATAGTDYTPTRGIVTFAAGEVRKTISVPILGDTVIEPDEIFFVDLSTPANARIGQGRGTGTILNDDSGAVRQLGSQEPQSLLREGRPARPPGWSPARIRRSVPPAG